MILDLWYNGFDIHTVLYSVNMEKIYTFTDCSKVIALFHISTLIQMKDCSDVHK